jgi:thymidine phosphorylase
VLDVKTGSGAFMAEYDDAKELAESLVAVANGAGLKTSALLTEMNEPLASAAGNAVEVTNAIAFLTGAHRDGRLEAVTLALAGELLVLGGLTPSAVEAEKMARAALEEGRAADLFQRMVSALGGPSDLVEHPNKHLPKAKVERAVLAKGKGLVASIDTRAIGLAIISLGGGRTRATDAIDHSVGLTGLAGIGAEVGPNRPLALVHARDEDGAEAAAAAIRGAYILGDPTARRLIYERIGSEAR